jgi:parallel beta-helix repeat protein
VLQNKDVSFPIIIGCKIINVGYIGIFLGSVNSDTRGGVVTNNLIDRSQIPSASVHQGCIRIRGNQNNDTTSVGWIVNNNACYMPDSPTDSSSLCIAVRELSYNSIVANNYCQGGTIGVSLVGSSYTSVANNQCINNSILGLEVGTSNHNTVTGNIIRGHAKSGGLTLDSTAMYNALAGNVAAETDGYPIYTSTGTGYNVFSGESISPVSKSYGIYLQGSIYTSLVGLFIWSDGTVAKSAMNRITQR